MLGFNAKTGIRFNRFWLVSRVNLVSNDLGSDFFGRWEFYSGSRAVRRRDRLFQAAE